MRIFRRLKGYTLIELLIVMLVVAVLAAIAVPSYRAHILKSRRVFAIEALLDLQLAQERFRANCTQYASTSGNANTCAGGVFQVGFTPDTDAATYYTFAITAANSSNFTATATAQSDQASDDSNCTVMTVNSQGPVAATDAIQWCWSR